MTLAHGIAIRKVLEHAALSNLRVLHLENCALKDNAFAEILKGLFAIDCCRTLTYKQNEFGPESLQALKPILEKSYPKNINELKLIHCITQTKSSAVIDELLHFIKEEQCSLSSLSLVGVKMSENAIGLLTDIINIFGTLHELDISWNELRSF